jgi:hypothetical protein
MFSLRSRASWKRQVAAVLTIAMVAQSLVLSLPSPAKATGPCQRIVANLNCGVCGSSACSATACVYFYLSVGWYCPAGTTENRRLVPAGTVNWKCVTVNASGYFTCVPNASTIWCVQTFPCDTSTACVASPTGGRFCSALAGGTGGGQCGLSSDSLAGPGCV